MHHLNRFSLCVLFINTFGNVRLQVRFEDAFKDCHKNDLGFDLCIMTALNDVRPFFKTGVPEWNLPPFDPFFAPEVAQTYGKSSFKFKLKLINATEAGWTESSVIQFKSDLAHNSIRYTQYFPAKFLKGLYHFSFCIDDNTLTSTSGAWNLELYGFTQTTTILREPVMLPNTTYVHDTPLKVIINIQTTEDMKLHITNLLGGYKVKEFFLDKIINIAWPPGFFVLKPFINDLVGIAFTDIFNKAFRNFPFNKLID